MKLESKEGISDEELRNALKKSIEGKNIKKVLLLPPDFTRMYSGAGKITAMYYDILSEYAEIDVMPALGTHVAMTRKEYEAFFGDKVPYEKMIVHNWRTDVDKIGQVPAEFVRKVSEGIVDQSIDVEVDRRLLDGSYDLIISIGQVVPHEVVGMANYSKNIFVGCGGSSMINASHMLGAFYGMERVMGRDFSPVRKVFDYAEENFIKDIPLMYVLTVTTNKDDDTFIHGLYIGRERTLFESAVKASQEYNLIHLDKPIKHAVVYLDPREFKSTWLGNKAVYRTRMAMATGGELTILAPGVIRFGEDNEVDRLIRKYGYCGRTNVINLSKENEDLENNMSVAAHLIHGSSDGRFNITYCTKGLSEDEVRGVKFSWAPYDNMIKKYDPTKLIDGYNTVDGEEIFYISNPAIGLWTYDGENK